MEDVERRSRDVAAFDRLRQVILHDELAARTVQDADALLHGGEGRGIDDAGRLRGEADVESDVIGERKKLFGGDEENRIFPRDGSGDKGIVSEEFHAKIARTARAFEADPPQAENAK